MTDDRTRPAVVSYERLAGSALGLLCGDALGMPVEGLSPQAIAHQHGRLDTMLPGRLPAGSYTDDGQMMIAIMQTLAEHGRLDGPRLARRFVACFDPKRGYGGRIGKVMERLASGYSWDQAGTDSFGNGGAMRVGPLGVFLADDPEALTQAALDQCRITHFHAQGLAGAVAQAKACALAARWGAAGRQRDPGEFVERLALQVQDIDAHTAARLRAMPALPRGDEPAARQALTLAYACDVRAAEAVPPAVGAFLAATDPEQAVVLAVSLGGDTDTIAAMAGAMAGAYWGLEALPPAWIQALENGPDGKDAVLELCRQALFSKTS